MIKHAMERGKVAVDSKNTPVGLVGVDGFHESLERGEGHESREGRPGANETLGRGQVWNIIEERATFLGKDGKVG